MRLTMKNELLAVSYAACHLLAPLFSNKLLAAGPLRLPAGMLLIEVAFGLLLVIAEVSGPIRARAVIVATAAARALAWLAAGGVALAPGLATPGFDRVVSESFRLFLAGEAALLASQFMVDVPLFVWLKRKLVTGFWARYNLATLPSQLVAWGIFVPAAFLGTGKPLATIFLSGLLVRTAAAVSLTPVFSWFVRRSV